MVLLSYLNDLPHVLGLPEGDVWLVRYGMAERRILPKRHFEPLYWTMALQFNNLDRKK
jgi:hypothetical protein